MKALTAAVLSLCFFITGCNTVSGVGKDLEAGGEKISETAEEVKNGE